MTDVNDNSPVFGQSTYTFEVIEGRANEPVVGTPSISVSFFTYIYDSCIDGYIIMILGRETTFVISCLVSF